MASAAPQIAETEIQFHGNMSKVWSSVFEVQIAIAN